MEDDIYPVFFRIGTFEVTSFGVLVAIGALVGVWLFNGELRRSGLPHDAVDVGVAGLVGGLIGAKGLWVVEHVAEEPLAGLMLSRGGMSWFGGLAGGLLAGLAVMYRRRLPPLAVLAAATPGLAFGHAIGRIGCFLVGDDYGRPSALPWAVAFPQGLPPTTVPVHPTQLYEAFVLIPLGVLLLRWRAAGDDDRVVLGRYFLFAGLVRFLIEFLRVNEPVLGVLTVAHVASVAAIGLGASLLLSSRRR